MFVVEVRNMVGSLAYTGLDISWLESLVEPINAAYDDWRALERVSAYTPADPPPVSAEDLSRAVQRGDIAPEACRVLWHADRPVALVTLGFNGGGRVARLGWLAVHPDYRGRGLGRELLAHAAEEARVRGFETLVTASHVDSRYEPALRLLESDGFEWVDRERCNLTLKMDLEAWEPIQPRLPEGFSLRTWRDGDEAAWTEIKRAVFEDNTPLGYWQNVFGNRHDFDPQGWYFCLEGDKPVGISAAVLTRYSGSGKVMGCCIEWVGTLPEYRGLGLGRALVTACVNYAYRFRPKPFVLVTQPFRKHAVRLYESLGFRTVREWRTYQKVL